MFILQSFFSLFDNPLVIDRQLSVLLMFADEYLDKHLYNNCLNDFKENCEQEILFEKKKQSSLLFHGPSGFITIFPLSFKQI